MISFKFRKIIYFIFFSLIFVQKSFAVFHSVFSPIFIHHPPCTIESLKTPNAFSPNGDGKNDRFCLEGWDQCVDEFEVMVFNRFGELLFESYAIDFCWDGYYKGQVLENGIYMFVIKAKTKEGEVFKRAGNITLIK